METEPVERHGAVAFYCGPLLYASDTEYMKAVSPIPGFGSREPLPEGQTHPDAYDAILRTCWRIVICR